MDGVEHSQNRPTNTVTEINFGLRSAGSERLARHGRYEPWSTYLRTAISVLRFAAHAPSQHCSAPAGSRLSAIGYWLSALGSRLSPIAYRLSAISSHLSAIGHRLSPISYRLSAIGYRLSAISYRLSAMRLMLPHSAVLLQRKRSLIPLAEGLRRSCDEVAE